MDRSLKPRLLLLALALCATVAQAQVSVDDAWVRATVARQTTSGMFAVITSTAGGKLVAASSPLAAAVEIHEMAMQGDVMKMHAIAGLDLPAGKPVRLESGGFHLMLIGLKQPLAAGATVPVTLTVEDKDGKRESVEVKAVVRALGASGHGPMKH